MPIKHADDIAFTCPACQGSLVAEAKCAGISLSCPHCLKWIQVPFPEGYDFSQEPVTVTAPEAVKSVVENELEATRQKLRKARADVAALEAELKTARTQTDPLRVALDAATKRLADSREEVTRLNEALETAKTARDDAEVAQTIAEKSAADIVQLQNELAEAQAALQQLEAERAAAQLAAQTAQTASQQAQELNAKSQHDAEETQKRYKALLATAHDERETLESQLARLQAQLTELQQAPIQQTLEQERARIAQLEAQVTSLQRERAGMISHRQDQSQIIEQLYEERGTRDREREQDEQLRSVLEGRVRSLESHLESANGALNTAQTALSDYTAQLEAETTAHTATRQALEVVSSEYEQQSQRQETLKTAFGELEAQLQKIGQSFNGAKTSTPANIAPFVPMKKRSA